MKNSFSRIVSLAVCIGVALAAFSSLPTGARAQKNKTTDTPVTSWIAGSGLDTTPTYRIQSDLLGSYQNNVDSVASLLQGCCGDWVLATSPSTSGSGRTVLVDFRDPVPNSGAAPPFAYQYIFPRIIAKAHDTTPGSIAGMKGLNSTILSTERRKSIEG